MATRYWRGETGTWSSSNTAVWSATSGGATGASVPTAADDVIFNEFSAANKDVVVTVSGAVQCRSLTVTGMDAAFNGTASPSLEIYGGISVPDATTFSSSMGTVKMKATTTGHTINWGTTNINALTGNGANFEFNGVGGGWTWATPFKQSTSAFITLLAGTLNTGNFAYDGGGFQTYGSTTRSLTLGTSTFTCRWSAGFYIEGPNLTFSGASASVVTTLSGSNVVLNGAFTLGSLTVNSGCSFNSGATIGTPTITTLTLTGSGQPQGMTMGSNLNVNTIVFNSVGPQSPGIFQSNQLGVQRTIVHTTWTTGKNDILFRDIQFANGPLTGTRFGDCGGNSNITFPAAKTVYWNHATNTGYRSTSWATTTSGTPDINNQPLPQDTAIIGGNAHAANLNCFANNDHLCSMQFTGTRSYTFYAPGSWFYGDLAFATTSTITHTASPFVTYFGKRSGTQTLSINGTVDANLRFEFGATRQLGRNLTVASGKYIISMSGGFNTQNFNLTAGYVAWSGDTAVTLGSSIITLNGASRWLWDMEAGATVNAGTSKIRLAGSGNCYFDGSGGNVARTYNEVELAMTTAGSSVVFYGSTSSAAPVTINTLSDALGEAGFGVGFQANSVWDFESFTLSGTPAANITVAGASGVATLRKAGPWNIGANSTISTGTAGFNAVAGHSDYLTVQNLTAVNTLPVGGGNLFFGSPF